MANKSKKYKVKLNSVEKVEDLLQETYDLACYQYNEAHNEMNKLSQSTRLSEEIIDGKVKYAKAMHDYLNDKDKAIGRKIEIAKLMTEVIKHGGDVEKTLNDTEIEKTGAINLDKIREAMSEYYTKDEEPKKYTLNKG
jgi:hypothetical protein